MVICMTCTSEVPVLFYMSLNHNALLCIVTKDNSQESEYCGFGDLCTGCSAHGFCGFLQSLSANNSKVTWKGSMLFRAEDENNIFLQNDSIYLKDHKASQSTTMTTCSLLWEPQISLEKGHNSFLSCSLIFTLHNHSLISFDVKPFNAAFYLKISSTIRSFHDNQLYEYGISFQCFQDCLYLHYQDRDPYDGNTIK
jgi:hypothetical protein